VKTENPGLILIDKPAGITSFQLLGPIKRAASTRKVGHAGTLDRFASGLMLVFVGQATRFVQYLSGADKEYVGEIRFGVETSTLDPEGEIVARSPSPNKSDIESVLGSFTGSISQRPPAFSALHIDGKRAYKRALDGEDVKMPERAVRIDALELLDWREGSDGAVATIRVACSKGTYIRSLARDIAIAAGSRGHLAALRRTRIGGFSLEEALPLDSLSDGAGLNGKLLWNRELIERIDGISVLTVSESIQSDALQGKPLVFGAGGLPDVVPGLYALIDEEDSLIALASRDDGSTRLRYRGVFN
jgi:tRNA pseudouridine55 synthase